MAKKKAKKAVKKVSRVKSKETPTLSEINKKLNLLLSGQQKIEKEEAKIEKQEDFLEKLEEKEILNEKEEIREEKKELNELEKLERLEKEVEKQVVPHPLKKITSKDIARGSVGALFGAVAHYTFIYGLKVAENISMTRAIMLFIISFIIGGVFLYATGFRKIKDPKVMAFLPLRLIVLYMTAVVISVMVLWFFEPGFGHTFEEAFVQTSTITLIAVIGACTADLLGKE